MAITSFLNLGLQIRFRVMFAFPAALKPVLWRVFFRDLKSDLPTAAPAICHRQKAIHFWAFLYQGCHEAAETSPVQLVFRRVVFSSDTPNWACIHTTPYTDVKTSACCAYGHGFLTPTTMPKNQGHLTYGHTHDAWMKHYLSACVFNLARGSLMQHATVCMCMHFLGGIPSSQVRERPF